VLTIRLVKLDRYRSAHFQHEVVTVSNVNGAVSILLHARSVDALMIYKEDKTKVGKQRSVHVVALAAERVVVSPRKTR
jgi:hypothetical protein